VQENGNWISILEYAKFSGKSISTIRRLIKSNKITFKKIDRKFYLMAEISHGGLSGLEYENLKLKNKILKQKEAISELQMLVTIYEENNIKPTYSI